MPSNAGSSLEQPDQDALGHHLDPGLRADLAVDADPVAYRFADGLPSMSAMRRAAARAASRRGSSMTIFALDSHGSSSSASGTRVVLPAPGGA